MNNPNKNSTTNGALWVIACSLAVIAACLVVLVNRQQRRAAQAEMAEAAPTPEAPPPRQASLAKQFPVRHADFAARAPAPTTEPALPTAEAALAPETRTAPAVVIGPRVSSGFAPLTTLTPTGSGATIAGRVVLKGTPPPENKIDFGPQCGRLHPGTNTTRFYVVSKDGGLANVFIFIKSGLEGKHFSRPSQSATLNQIGCLYEPYVLGLMTGQKLRIKNSDPFLHNVHARPLVEGNRAFNQAEMAGAVITKTFREPEIPLKLSCDAHPWMFAYVCVVDNPFFAVTDAEGNYSISNVPPGNYVLEAFHVKTHRVRGGVTEQIAATAGETTTANFTIELPPSLGAIARGR